MRLTEGAMGASGRRYWYQTAVAAGNRYLHPRYWFDRDSLDWINVAKGIGIVLVVIGHFHPSSSPDYWDSTIAVIYSFHMSLFFTLSGYLYVHNKYPYKEFVEKKVKRLVYPFFSIALIYLIIKWLAARFDHVNYPVDAASVAALLYNPIASYVPLLWFVQALFIIFLVYPPLRRVLNGIAILCLFIVLNAVFGSKWPLIGRAMDSMPFFALGVVLRESRVVLVSTAGRRWSYPGAFGALFVAGCVMAFADGGRLTHDYLMQVFLGAAGSMMVMSLSNAICDSKKRGTARVLFHIGYYSMSIYLFHTLFESSARGVILHASHDASIPFLLVVLISVACGVIFPMALEKYGLRKWRMTRVALLGMAS